MMIHLLLLLLLLSSHHHCISWHAAAHRTACRATARCCPSCCLSCRRVLLPIVLPVTPPWAAACRITCRAVVRCCPSCRPSCHHALLPVASVTIPAVTPTFSLTSHPAASPEVPRDTSSGHVSLGSHVIHPHASPSRPMPRNPVNHPRWVQLRESPPSTPDAPDEPESSADPQIDSAAMTEDLSILQGLLSGLSMSLWSTVPDITDRH